MQQNILQNLGSLQNLGIRAAMGLPDFQLIIQAVLYLTAVGTGLVVSIPVALTDVSSTP